MSRHKGGWALTTAKVLSHLRNVSQCAERTATDQEQAAINQVWGYVEVGMHEYEIGGDGQWKNIAPERREGVRQRLRDGFIDGAFLPANSVQQKVWRLEPDELYPSTLSLLREDVLCDASTHGEYLGKRLSDFADDRCFPFHHTPDGTVEATCDFTVPALSGVYRIPFRMLRTDDAGLIVGCVPLPPLRSSNFLCA